MALTDVLPKSKRQQNELFFKQAQNSLQKNSFVDQTQQLVKIEGINSQLEFITKLIENKG